MKYFGLPARVYRKGDHLHVVVKDEALKKHGYPSGEMLVVLTWAAIPEDIKGEIMKGDNGLPRP